MRPQHHQKSRSRGRGRKPQNPLSRNFESNGPDVKIRGNASHIAEKYSTLARDALASGDTVMAENYFQHAEHYNRIVAAAQAQKAEEQQQQQQANGRDSQPGNESEGASDSNAEQAADAKTPTNGSPDDSEETQKEPRQQKNGRARRPRKHAGEDGDKKDGSNKPAAEADANGTEAEVPVEAITEDASKLPESITGGFLGDDN